MLSSPDRVHGVLFCTVDYTVYRVKFEIGSNIKSPLKIALARVFDLYMLILPVNYISTIRSNVPYIYISSRFVSRANPASCSETPTARVNSS
jgi:hypothetical protein